MWLKAILQRHYNIGLKVLWVLFQEKNKQMYIIHECMIVFELSHREQGLIALLLCRPVPIIAALFQALRPNPQNREYLRSSSLVTKNFWCQHSAFSLCDLWHQLQLFELGLISVTKSPLHVCSSVAECLSGLVPLLNVSSKL